MCVILVIVTSFLFGKDFYLRETPRIVLEKILTDTFSNVVLKPSNFIFAFRIEDGDSNYLENVFFKMELQYLNYTKDENKEFQLEKHVINGYKRCDEITIEDKNFSKNKNLTQYYCIDLLNNTEFGGSWNSDSVSYFILTFSNFPENPNNKDEINDFITNDYIYVSMFYQEYYFVPSDQTDPLKLRYNNYFFQTTPYSGKTDRFYFRSFYLEDDIGWIFKSKINYEKYGLDHISSDYFTIHSNDTTIDYYQMVLYYQSDYEKIYRSYMKIQELAAQVGGFMKMIYF